MRKGKELNVGGEEGQGVGRGVAVCRNVPGNKQIPADDKITSSVRGP